MADAGAGAGIARNGFAEADLRLLSAALAVDALDALGRRAQALAPRIGPIDRGMHLVGWARAVLVESTRLIPDEPYAGEMAAIAALEPGDVPVYQVGADVDAALFGELFSLAATAQGAAGAVVDGPVRDVRQLRELGFRMFATGVSPYDTKGRAEVVGFDVPIVCAGVSVRTGDLVVGDDDGVVIVPADLVADVVALVRAKTEGEDGAKADLIAGMPVHEVWAKWGVF